MKNKTHLMGLNKPCKSGDQVAGKVRESQESQVEWWSSCTFQTWPRGFGECQDKERRSGERRAPRSRHYLAFMLSTLHKITFTAPGGYDSVGDV